MDPRYKELCYVICDYNDIEYEKYNYFGTWAMVHFGDKFKNYLKKHGI